jgi:hypothetical protein
MITLFVTEQPGRPGGGWDGNIKTELGQISSEAINGIHLAQDILVDFC